MPPSIANWTRAKAWLGRGSSLSPILRWLTLALLIATTLVVALVAWESRRNSFPDEDLHVISASYYLDHWLPPAIGEELAPYAGVHGVSYFMLWPPQAAYALFAKAAVLVRAPPMNRWLAYRGFCVGLWAALLWCVLRHARRMSWLLLLVGLTPQVWYIFTYFSADAFSYAMAALIVVLLGTPDSLARRFIETGRPLVGGVVLGACFGGLALSKMNYMTFALYATVYCCVLAARVADRAAMVRRALTVVCVAMVVAGPFLVTDLSRNGVSRGERFEQLRESFAGPGFKPSDIEAGVGYRGLSLRQRGVSARAMFSRPWRWGLFTTRSFFGVYGTMDIFSPPGINGVQKVLCGALLVLAWLRRRSFSLDRRILGGVALAMIFATLAAAFWRAWTFDFQAQGRYVFAIIPIVTSFLAEVSESTDEPAHWLAFLSLVLCGFASIVSALPGLS